MNDQDSSSLVRSVRVNGLPASKPPKAPALNCRGFCFPERNSREPKRKSHRLRRCHLAPEHNRHLHHRCSHVGWTCRTDPVGPQITTTTNLATLTSTRSDALAVGAAYPTITVTVTVAINAPASVTNIVSVSGGGETNTVNNTNTDITSIVAPITGYIAQPMQRRVHRSKTPAT